MNEQMNDYLKAASRKRDRIMVYEFLSRITFSIDPNFDLSMNLMKNFKKISKEFSDNIFTTDDIGTISFLIDGFTKKISTFQTPIYEIKPPIKFTKSKLDEKYILYLSDMLPILIDTIYPKYILKPNPKEDKQDSILKLSLNMFELLQVIKNINYKLNISIQRDFPWEYSMINIVNIELGFSRIYSDRGIKILELKKSSQVKLIKKDELEDVKTNQITYINKFIDQQKEVGFRLFGFYKLLHTKLKWTGDVTRDKRSIIENEEYLLLNNYFITLWKTIYIHEDRERKMYFDFDILKPTKTYESYGKLLAQQLAIDYLIWTPGWSDVKIFKDSNFVMELYEAIISLGLLNDTTLSKELGVEQKGGKREGDIYGYRISGLQVHSVLKIILKTYFDDNGSMPSKFLDNFPETIKDLINTEENEKIKWILPLEMDEEKKKKNTMKIRKFNFLDYEKGWKNNMNNNLPKIKKNSRKT